jgi:hypothetical protein
MLSSKFCKFYRDSETISVGKGLAYCDFDCTQTTCEGDMDFCEKPDALKKYLLEQRKREGGPVWEEKRSALSLGSRKA